MDLPNPADRAAPVTPATPVPPAPGDVPGDSAPAGAAPPPALSGRSWLAQNGPFLIVVAALLALAYKNYGLQWMLMVGKAGLGLGFLIFIHELGHFLAAKWCDVHVLTFSIGFGPALPGCSFTRGETQYMIGALPLGGYVNMVGEGPDADEDENYPRSFKNKTVGQRMLIISAGVIMNLLFAAIVCVTIFLTSGLERPTAMLGSVEPAGPAWTTGVRSGWRITRIRGNDTPYFDQLKVAVALSQSNKSLEFEFLDRDGKTQTREVTPRRDGNAKFPIIGVSPLNSLKLLPELARAFYSSPVSATSAAAAARVLELGEKDVPVAATDPDKPDTLSPLATDKKDPFTALCQRMTRLVGKPMAVEVRRAAGGTEKIELPVGGFAFDDAVVATTDPDATGGPYAVSDLPYDDLDGEKLGLHDPYAFRRRMERLAGMPAVVRVRRAAGDKGRPAVLSLLVPPAFNVTFGMRMKMGKVAAVRPGSPAEKAGVQPDDTIVGAEMSYDGGPAVKLEGKSLDPVRLPWELESRARGDRRKDPSKWKVTLTVRGQRDRRADETHKLGPMAWDDVFSVSDELPVSPSSPLSLPQLGVAYWVESVVQSVEPGSPADLAGLKVNDDLRAVSLRERTADDAKQDWSKGQEMKSVRGKNQEVYDQWGYYHLLMQRTDYPTVKFEVRRGGATKTITLPENPAAGDNPGVTAVPDESWPLASRGFAFAPDTRVQKADSVGQAFWYGLDYTRESIQQLYLNLSSLAFGRISTESLGGPLEIGWQAFQVARQDWPKFMLFLALISINLAVVNFLPIPILDGGHMVFLIYEKLRGRPPSETVRIIATYIGLAMLLTLMVYVIYLDIKRRVL